jgi:hypothetical protein
MSIVTTMCDTCYGNQVVWRFWKSDKNKMIMSEWLYCRSCYPDSDGTWPMLEEAYEWVEIDSTEFGRLEAMQYPDRYMEVHPT